MPKSEAMFIFCASEFANDAVMADEFVRVAPYCDAPQYNQAGERVIQRFGIESAKKLVEAFNANAKKLLTRLGFGSASIPFYNGHPDFANASSQAERDMRVYAEAEALEARADGLYAKIKRTPFLQDLKNALGRLEISPRWICEKNAKDGTFNPVRLLSFGLVKQGNLPGADFINEQQKEEIMNREQLEQAAALLGIDPKLISPEALLTAISALVDEVGKSKGASDAANSEKEAEKERADKAEADAAESKKTAEDATAKAEQEAEKRKKTEKDFANFLLDKAAFEKRIIPATREAFEKLFDADFANARVMLDALPIHPDFANKSEDDAISAAKKDEEKRIDAANSRQEAGKKLADMTYAKLAEMRKEDANAEFIDALNIIVCTPEGRKLYEAANAIV